MICFSKNAGKSPPFYFTWIHYLTMSIRVQLSPFLRNYVPNYDNYTGIILDDANRLSVQQIISKLDIPQEEVITIMVNV